MQSAPPRRSAVCCVGPAVFLPRNRLANLERASALAKHDLQLGRALHRLTAQHQPQYAEYDDYGDEDLVEETFANESEKYLDKELKQPVVAQPTIVKEKEVKTVPPIASVRAKRMQDSSTTMKSTVPPLPPQTVPGDAMQVATPMASRHLERTSNGSVVAERNRDHDSHLFVLEQLRREVDSLAAALGTRTKNETYEEQVTKLKELESLHARASAAILKFAKTASASKNGAALNGEINGLVHKLALLCSQIESMSVNGQLAASKPQKHQHVEHKMKKAKKRKIKPMHSEQQDAERQITNKSFLKEEALVQELLRNNPPPVHPLPDSTVSLFPSHATNPSLPADAVKRNIGTLVEGLLDSLLLESVVELNKIEEATIQTSQRKLLQQVMHSIEGIQSFPLQHSELSTPRSLADFQETTATKTLPSLFTTEGDSVVESMQAYQQSDNIPTCAKKELVDMKFEPAEVIKTCANILLEEVLDSVCKELDGTFGQFVSALSYAEFFPEA